MMKALVLSMALLASAPAAAEKFAVNGEIVDTATIGPNCVSVYMDNRGFDEDLAFATCVCVVRSVHEDAKTHTDVPFEALMFSGIDECEEETEASGPRPFIEKYLKD